MQQNDCDTCFVRNDERSNWKPSRNELLRQIEQLTKERDEYKALYHSNKRCECSDKDACFFADRADKAEARVVKLHSALEAISDKAAYVADDIDRWQLVAEIEDLANEALKGGEG